MFQLQVINIGFVGHDFSPYELTHNYVQNCFIPLFGAVKNMEELARITSSDKQIFQNLMRKLSEVSIALIRCHPNLEVPEIRLNFDPDIKSRLAKARAEGKQPKIEDFNDLME